jgi:hypothetical protein
MGYVVNALYDKNTDPILKTDDGTSSFVILSSFLVNAFDDTSENQQTILNSTVNQANATRTLIREESSDIMSRISREANAVVDAVGGPWAMIAAVVGLIFLLYIVIRYLKPDMLPDLISLQEPRPVHYGQETYQEPYQEQARMPTNTGGLKGMIPFGNKPEGPPPCYKDGVTYDIMQNMECAACPYKDECAQAKIARGAQTMKQEQQMKEKPQEREEVSDDLEDW